MIRVGQGFDVHAFSDDESRPLVLGGVTFEGERGLAGHSDADVVAHACADALLSACGLGDLGEQFRTPTNDGAVPTASSCCNRSSSASVPPGGRPSMSIARSCAR